MASNFQRARSDEQRAQRRQAILGTAAAMLTEMPVAQLSLNELSRRVGLAKSNVLRYFESREAVLLDLLGDAVRDWLTDLGAELGAAVRPGEGTRERGDALAAAVAASMAARPVLCDLVSAQAAVLERNVSMRVAAQYKHGAITNTHALAGLFVARIPELGDVDALRLAAATLMVAGAAWTHAQPSAAMLAAYEADPSLASMRLDFSRVLRETLEVVISGLLARHAD